MTKTPPELDLLDHEERAEIIRLAEEHKWTIDQILEYVELKFRARYLALLSIPQVSHD